MRRLFMKGRWQLAVLAVCAAAVLGFAPVAKAADKITVGALRFTSHAPTFLAYERGYFKEQGLDVELKFFDAAQPMAIAIASGDVDFGITAITGGLISLAEKKAVKVIGGVVTEEKGIQGQVILVSKGAYNDGVTTPKKLAGRSFGITTAGSSFHYMIAKIAKAEGLTMSQVQLKPLQTTGAIIGALKTNQVDAWTILPDIGKRLVQDGVAVEIGKVADYILNYQITTVFTSTRNVESRKDLVKRFLAAFVKGANDFNAALVDKTAGEAEAEAVTRLIHKYVNADQPYEKAASSIRAGAMRISPGARLNLASIEDQLNWFKSEGLVKGTINLDTLVDTSFVETAPPSMR